MPVPKSEWRQPSLFVPKDQFGNDVVRTSFRLRARANDGYIVWEGIFSDRDDFDAFLFALAVGSLRVERALWRLPTPEWHPGISTDLAYEFATITVLTTTGSNQTYTSPSDWGNSANTIECIGGGASGAAGSLTSLHVTGGGGGAYGAITNFSFASPGSTTATYRVGAQAAGVNSTGGTATTGTAGNPTWWNDTANPGGGTTNAKCSGAGGSAGVGGSGSQNGGAGGTTAASWGQTKFDGGAGGNMTGASGYGASGGGGAAGPNGAGNSGTSRSSTGTDIDLDGGSGDAGFGGAAGLGGNSNYVGGNGSEMAGGAAGSGGGGGGRSLTNTSVVPGTGGNYGAGGGAMNVSAAGGTSLSGFGAQGVIVVTYTPTASTTRYPTNSPMLGM